MGVFSLLLQQGGKYFFNWTDEQGKTGVTEITAQKEAGAFIHVSPTYKKVIFTVGRSENAGEAFKTMQFLYAQNNVN